MLHLKGDDSNPIREPRKFSLSCKPYSRISNDVSVEWMLALAEVLAKSQSEDERILAHVSLRTRACKLNKKFHGLVG